MLSNIMKLFTTEEQKILAALIRHLILTAFNVMKRKIPNLINAGRRQTVI